jgi:hypothetical protein
LSQELRENCRYLKEAGWRNTAALMITAANEIDRLDARLKQLERRSDKPRAVQDLVRKLITRRRPRFVGKRRNAANEEPRRPG